jgi:tRNA uridine 5-carbamoylmethylation protein Kti12
MEKVLFILRGLPGSGKSTAAKLLADSGYAVCGARENYVWPVCTADDYFLDDNNNYIFDATKLGAAHKNCQAKCEYNMLINSEKIFVANTSTTVKELNAYYKLAEKYDYKVISMIVENRHNGVNEHGVSDIILNKMKDRFAIKL